MLRRRARVTEHGADVRGREQGASGGADSPKPRWSWRITW
jgi:hypothetical protein